MKLKNGSIFLAPIPKPVTETGLVQVGFIPRRGIVKLVGEEISGEPMIVSPGDEVLYNEVLGNGYEYEGQEGFISNQRDCELIVNRHIPLNNNVVIEVSKDNSRLKSGLYIDTSYDPHAHAVRVGTVVAVPQYLVCGNMANRNFIPHLTDMELIVGDTVIFDANAFFNAVKYGNCLDKDSEKQLLIINYQMCYVVLRKVEEVGCFHRTDWVADPSGDQIRNYEKIIPLNGNILVEPENEVIETKLILPETVKKKHKHFGIVRHVGSLNRAYYYGSQQVPGDGGIFNPGDRIVYQAYSNIRIEDDLHQVLDRPYCRVQRKYIFGKFLSEKDVAKQVDN